MALAARWSWNCVSSLEGWRRELKCYRLLAGERKKRGRGRGKKMEESCPEPPLIQFLFKETMEMHLDEQGDEWRRCCKLWLLVNWNLDKYFSAGRTDMMMERRRVSVHLSTCENSRVVQSGRLKHNAKARWRSTFIAFNWDLCSRINTVQFLIIRLKQLKGDKVVVFSRFSAISHQLMLSTCCWCSLMFSCWCWRDFQGCQNGSWERTSYLNMCALAS